MSYPQASESESESDELDDEDDDDEGGDDRLLADFLDFFCSVVEGASDGSLFCFGLFAMSD